ncbi:MAG: hypothetical protein BMS9Abin14_562 [Gammaproteobacteria bacterium]|nr:MAG: hypothetical protein BMS9Abin14_562 [Gammaproteobacteria bacterium]
MNDVLDSGVAPPEVAAIDSLERERLEDMLAAGYEILECYRVLTKGGLNIVGELLKGQGTFYEFDHYPKGDIYDDASSSQYYYHAHREDHEEHGHFHTFLRAGAIPEHVQPVAYDGDEPWPTGDEALSHLIAISMSPPGFPLGLFATNRWVTAEAWYRAADVIDMVDRFRIDHANPSWPTNRWMTAMMCLFKPQITALLEHRDAVVEAWVRDHPGVDVYEDRELDITGWLPVSVDDQLAAVRAALA